MSAAEIAQIPALEIGQMSAVERDRCLAVGTGHLSAAGTGQKYSVARTGIYLVSTHNVKVSNVPISHCSSLAYWA